MAHALLHVKAILLLLKNYDEEITMNKFMKIAIPAVTAFALISSIAYAGHKDGDYKNCSAENKVEKLTEKLGLNENQQQLLREFTEAKQTMRENRKENREARKSELKALAEKDVIAVSDLTDLMDQKREARKAAMQPVLEKFVAFRNSLTEEQRAESQGMIKKLLMGGHKKYNDKKRQDS